MRLHDYIRACARTPFKLGRHDCATFATGWVQAAIGRDITHGLSGRYRTYAGGLRHVRKLGYADHVDLVAGQLRERDSIASAMIGDVVTCDTGDGIGLGICGGDTIHMLGASGMIALPLSHGIRAFEVA